MGRARKTRSTNVTKHSGVISEHKKKLMKLEGVADEVKSIYL